MGILEASLKAAREEADCLREQLRQSQKMVEATKNCGQVSEDYSRISIEQLCLGGTKNIVKSRFIVQLRLTYEANDNWVTPR